MKRIDRLLIFLNRLTSNFLCRMTKKDIWGRIEIRKELDESIRDTLRLTHNKVEKNIKTKTVSQLGNYLVKSHIDNVDNICRRPIEGMIFDPKPVISTELLRQPDEPGKHEGVG